MRLQNSTNALTAPLLLALGLSPITASAEPDAATLQAEQQINVARGGPIDDPEHLTGTGFRKIETDAQIETIDGIVSANFAFGLRLASPPRTTVGSEQAIITAGFTSLAIKASVPLSQGDDALPIEFKNIGNKGKLTFGFTHFRPRVISGVGTQPNLFVLAKTCVQNAGRKWVSDSFPPLTQVRVNQIAIVLASLSDEETAKNSWDDAMLAATTRPDVSDFGPVAKKQCHPSGGIVTNDLPLIQLYAREAGQPGLSSQLNRSTLFFGSEGSIGYNKFSTLDRVGYRLNTKDRLGFDVSARAGLVFSGSGTLISAGGGYTRSYEAQDEGEVCSPPDPSGATKCIKGQDGAPSRKETGYVEASLRQILLRGSDGLAKVAMAPRVAYLFEDDAFEFKLPIYLQRNSDGGLDSGIQAIYNTDDKEVFVGAFVGVPF